MTTELTDFLAAGLADQQRTAGVQLTLTRVGTPGSVVTTGTFSPGASTYTVEVSGNLYTMAATALLPVSAVSTSALLVPQIGDTLRVSGDATPYKIIGVRGSTLDPAYHLDLALTARPA